MLFAAQASQTSQDLLTFFDWNSKTGGTSQTHWHTSLHHRPSLTFTNCLTLTWPLQTINYDDYSESWAVCSMIDMISGAWKVFLCKEIDCLTLYTWKSQVPSLTSSWPFWAYLFHCANNTAKDELLSKLHLTFSMQMRCTSKPLTTAFPPLFGSRHNVSSRTWKFSNV